MSKELQKAWRILLKATLNILAAWKQNIKNKETRGRLKSGYVTNDEHGRVFLFNENPGIYQIYYSTAFKYSKHFG